VYNLDSQLTFSERFFMSEIPSKLTPQWSPRPELEARLSEGNPYPGTEELAAKEGPDWWRKDEHGNSIEDEEDPEDN
jgi:hypothetical protein